MAKKKKAPGKQKALPAIMPAGEKKMHDLAQDILSLQEKRLEVTHKLKDKRGALTKAMKKENCKKYHGGGLEVTFQEKAEGVKVSRDKAR